MAKRPPRKRLTTWTSDRPFVEIEPLIHHVKALGIERVWVDDIPPDRVQKLRPGALLHDGLHASVILDAVVDGVTLSDCPDLVFHRGSVFRGLDTDRVATMLAQLPEGPRTSLLEIVDTWIDYYADQARQHREDRDSACLVQTSLIGLREKATPHDVDAGNAASRPAQ